MPTIIITLLTSFSICFWAIPAIMRIAETKNLYDEPNERSSHKIRIPSLGGLGIFIGFVFSIFFWIPEIFLPDLKYLLCSMMILVPIGLKDDISPISPLKKLLGQVIAVIILVFFADLKINSLHGVLGIYELASVYSIPLSIGIIITIINGFNLIDGINGLAGGVSLLCTLLFGIWFYLVDLNQYALISFALSGAIIGFLYYNVTPAKIFLGDTGSLLLGLICSFLCIKFLNTHALFPNHPYAFEGVPVIAISILILPLFDTFRVFTNRILKGKSPIEPDRNHVHHILIDTGINHTSATLILLTVNVAFIFIAFSLQHLGTFTALGLMVCFAFVLISWAVKRRDYYLSQKKGEHIDFKTNYPNLILKKEEG